MLALDVDEVQEPGGVRGDARGRAPPRLGGGARRSTTTAASCSSASTATPSTDFVWELPAGRLDPGESPEAGARRELEEEVGLRAARSSRCSTSTRRPASATR